jgi:hypothetical protein
MNITSNSDSDAPLLLHVNCVKETRQTSIKKVVVARLCLTNLMITVSASLSMVILCLSTLDNHIRTHYVPTTVKYFRRSNTKRTDNFHNTTVDLRRCCRGNLSHRYSYIGHCRSRIPIMCTFFRSLKPAAAPRHLVSVIKLPAAAPRHLVSVIKLNLIFENTSNAAPRHLVSVIKLPVQLHAIESQ